MPLPPRRRQATRRLCGLKDRVLHLEDSANANSADPVPVGEAAVFECHPRVEEPRNAAERLFPGELATPEPGEDEKQDWQRVLMKSPALAFDDGVIPDAACCLDQP